MPNINDAFPSIYLKASDLKGAEPVVTIERVAFEPVGQKREMKPVIYFVGKQKGLVLNKTNANRIVQITGTGMTEHWAGSAIKLYATETEFQGETVDCIRIRMKVDATPPGRQEAPQAPPPAKPSRKPAAKAEPPPEPPEPPPTPPITEDEIPF